ncbi:DDE_3 domain-containing protein [Trichonephila clavipes]|nr:DDE_3 domain-containing protein [Trichonephila clavipes]
MDDNARPHRARIVEEYLEDHGLERMEWPARSPDLNPIKHLWVYLGREVAALNPPPGSLHELKQGLLCVWSLLPIPVSDNLINSIGNRCRQCIQGVSPRMLLAGSLKRRLHKTYYDACYLKFWKVIVGARTPSKVKRNAGTFLFGQSGLTISHWSLPPLVRWTFEAADWRGTYAGHFSTS